MNTSVTRSRLIKELKFVPDYKLLEIYDFVHCFRLELRDSKEGTEQIMKFAGCWKDMPEEIFNDFLDGIFKRRKQAFSRRRLSEACIS